MADFDLRSYQSRALDALHEAIQEEDILLLQAATGAGKTVMVVRMIQRYFSDHPDRSFLILMHKKELVEQFLKSFQKFSDIDLRDIGVACAGVSKDVDTEKRVTIASVQTLSNHLNTYPGADLIVVDETHRIGHDHDSQYRVLLDKLHEYKPHRKVIGVTATAYRLGHGMIYGEKCKPGLVNFFPRLTHRVTYAELVEEGHLMALTGRVASAASLTEDLKHVDVSGDYNLGQLGQVMGKTTHVTAAVDGYEEYGLHHDSVCVFACTIEHVGHLCRAFNERGHKAVPIHSKLSPVEREANLKSWQTGQVKIAVSVNILVEGFDFPALSCLIFCRPTKSPTVYVQAIGRILRKAEGKEEALLIDLTDNTLSFGLNLDEPLFTIPKGGGNGEAPQKVCPGFMDDGTLCGAVLHASLLYCHHCGYKFVLDEVVESKLGEMMHVKFGKEQKEKPPPQKLEVTYVDYQNHESRSSGKNLVKVTYECGLTSVSEYICLPDHYGGFAVDKARKWWERRTSEQFPESVEEFLFLCDELDKPYAIEVEKDGKFDRIVEHHFSGEDLDNLAVDDFETMEESGYSDIDVDDIPF